jgi:hypothetical protein
MLKQCLSLSWGPSFAELETSSGWLRSYTAQQPPQQLLKNTVAADAELKKARVSMSVTRRILNTRLGNSVAQIVTEGFEHWVLLRQEAEPGHFDLAPNRREPLANPENLFGIKERISADGKVLHALQIQDLEKIATTLKSKQIERVCLNFLNSHRNPVHQLAAQKFLQEKGFQVFSRTRSSQSPDELSAWRRNLLDASLASFFTKAFEDFEEVAPGLEFEFLDTEKGFASKAALSTSALLFGREKSLQRSKPLLYFGAEEWGWILPEDQNLWRSPWGLVELKTPVHGFFQAQPGLELVLNSSGQIRWGENSGMDPGPVIWGRSSKLTLLDFVGWHFETKPALRRNEKTEAKSRDLFESFKKNSRDWRSYTPEHAQKDIFETMMNSIITDLAVRLSSDEFLVAGVMAPHILPALKKAKPKWKFESLNEGGEFHETETFWGPHA